MSAPSKALCRLVDERDGYACIRCGRSLQVTSGSRHHRLRRRDGGHRASILVLLCGSGTTGCHGWVHANPEAARRSGWIIPALRKPELDPELVPMWTKAHGWVQLNDRGTSTRMREAEAVELLFLYGMRSPEVTASALGDGDGEISDRLRDVDECLPHRPVERGVGLLGALTEGDAVVGEFASDGEELRSVDGSHDRTLPGGWEVA